MNKPFPAYAGTESFIFVCYAHADAERVYPEISQLNDSGIRLWYDEGISPGTRWSEELADAISRASAVLFFASDSSVASEHCNDEITFALDEGIPVIVAQFEPVKLPPGLRLRLGSHQMIQGYELSRQQFETKLRSALAGHLNEVEETQVAPPDKSRKRTFGARWRWASAAAVLAVALLAYWLPQQKADTELSSVMSPFSLAVLPFREFNAGDDVNGAAIAETITRELSGETFAPLRASLPAYDAVGYRVAPFASTASYAGSTVNPEDIAQELDVRFLIGGSVRLLSSDDVQISAELIDTKTNETLWVYSKTYPQEDVSRDERAARDIGRSVIALMPGADWYAGVKKVAADPLAYSYYVKALSASLLFGGPLHDIEISENFARAQQLDPEFYWFNAHQLSHYLRLMRTRLTPPETELPLAELIDQMEAGYARNSWADEAFRSQDATSMRADLAYLQFDFEKSQPELERALGVAPNDVRSLFVQALMAGQRGRPEELLLGLQKAFRAGGYFSSTVEGIGRLHTLLGRPGAAVAFLDEYSFIAPDEYSLGRLLIAKSAALKALGESNAAKTLAEEAQVLLEVSHPAAVVPLLVQSGDTGRAEKLLERAERGDLNDAANIQDLILGYAEMNEPEKATHWTRLVVEARQATIVGALRLQIAARSGNLSETWRAVEREMAVLPVPVP